MIFFTSVCLVFGLLFQYQIVCNCLGLQFIISISIIIIIFFYDQ